MDEKFAFAEIGGLGIAYDHLDERCLTCSVRTQNRNTRTERHFDVDVVERIEIVSRISEIDALHLQELLR